MDDDETPEHNDQAAASPNPISVSLAQVKPSEIADFVDRMASHDNPRVREMSEAGAEAFISLFRLGSTALDQVTATVKWLGTEGQAIRRGANHVLTLMRAEKRRRKEIPVERIDPYFFDRWRSGASDAEDPTLQELWAALLNEELDKPGSISKITMKTLTNLDARDARAFEQVTSIALTCAEQPFILMSDALMELYWDGFGISQDLVYSCKSVGLIQSSADVLPTAPYEETDVEYATTRCKVTYSPEAELDAWRISDEIGDAVHRDEDRMVSRLASAIEMAASQHRRVVETISFTRAGRELYQVANKSTHELFLEAIADRLHDTELSLQLREDDESP